MNITATVIDDEQFYLDLLAEQINHVSQEMQCQIDAVYFTDPDQIESYDSRWFIINIELDGKSGFDVAKKIKQKNRIAKIIFYTVHNELVFRSFGEEVFFFIRKTRIHDDLIDCLRKYLRVSKGYYKVNSPTGITMVLWDDIIYFEIVKNDLFICTYSGNEYQERKTMKQLIQEIPEYTFIQPSVHFLVNVSFISSIETSQVTLYNGMKFPIAKAKRKKVLIDFERSVLQTYSSGL